MFTVYFTISDIVYIYQYLGFVFIPDKDKKGQIRPEADQTQLCERLEMYTVECQRNDPNSGLSVSLILCFFKSPSPPSTYYDTDITNTNVDVTQNLADVMKSVADFLEVSYSTDQERALLHHLSFAQMKNNVSVNFEEDIRRMERAEDVVFIREGGVGNWKKVLSPEFSKLYEEWTNKNLEGTDYPKPTS